VGTATFYDPDATVTIAEGIDEYLSGKGLSSPRDIVGRGNLRGDDAQSADRRG
jgi:dihydroorotate dehydrogenase